MSEIYVSQLTTYPVKSCGGIDLPNAEVGPQGLPYDRQWMVGRANGTFLSQRTHPQLALVETAITPDSLVISAPSHGTVSVPLGVAEYAPTTPETDVDIFKKVGRALLVGGTSDEFFSDYLGMEARLFRASQPRTINPAYRRHGLSEEIGFADGAPYLLASQASLRALQAADERTIEMKRFRPNIVIDGNDLLSYEEDYWRDIEIAGKRFHVGWACARCPMPNVDQDTGTLPKPADRFVTQALQRTRSGIDARTDKKEVFFGQNLIPQLGRRTVISVMDRVDVIHAFGAPNFKSA